MNILRPYQGRDALAHSPKSDPFTPRRDKLGDVELICVVVTLRNLESIMAQLNLRDFGGVMIKFYSAVADAIMTADGDVDEFCGPSVVGHFNVLNRVAEDRIVECAMAMSSRVIFRGRRFLRSGGSRSIRIGRSSHSGAFFRLVHGSGNFSVTLLAQTRPLD